MSDDRKVIVRVKDGGCCGCLVTLLANYGFLVLIGCHHVG